jgi:hypothetical protein
MGSHHGSRIVTVVAVDSGNSVRKPRAIGLRKHVTITVIPLVGRRGTRRRIAPAGQLISPAGIDGILHEEAEIVERFFPGAEFRLVALRDGNFNFVQTKMADESRDESTSSFPIDGSEVGRDEMKKLSAS